MFPIISNRKHLCAQVVEKIIKKLTSCCLDSWHPNTPPLSFQSTNRMTDLSLMRICMTLSSFTSYLIACYGCQTHHSRQLIQGYAIFRPIITWIYPWSKDAVFWKLDKMHTLRYIFSRIPSGSVSMFDLILQGTIKPQNTRLWCLRITSSQTHQQLKKIPRVNQVNYF